MEFKKLILMGMLACSTVVGLQAAQANVYEQEQVIVPQFYEIQNWIQSAAKDRETVLTDEQVYVWFENEVKTFKYEPKETRALKKRKACRTKVLEHLVEKEAYKQKTIKTVGGIFAVNCDSYYVSLERKIGNIMNAFLGDTFNDLKYWFCFGKKGEIAFVFYKDQAKEVLDDYVVIPGVNIFNPWHVQAFNWVANNKLKTAGMVLTAVAAADVARHRGNPKKVIEDVKRLGGWLKSFVR